MHTFLDNFHQGGKYSAQIASHQAELRRKEKFPDKKCLNISYLQTDYLNLDKSSSGSSGHNERSHFVQAKCTIFGVNNHSAEKCFKRIRKEKNKACAVDVSYNKKLERLPLETFICGSEYHMITKCPNPPKDNKKRRKQVRFIEKGNPTCNNGENDDDHKIYTSMARMSSDDKCKSVKYGDSLQLTNWILDSGATCHMTPEVTDFITGSLEDTDKYIEVANGHHVTAKQKGSVRIQVCNDNGKTFFTTLYNVLLAPDLCDILFSIIT